MPYYDQTNRRRFAFAAFAAYTCAALAAGVVPLLTVGLFPDFRGSPAAAQEKIAAMTTLMSYAQLALLATGAVAILATAAWVHGAYANLEALPSASAPMHRWFATILVVVPGINVIGGPVVLWCGLRESRRSAGERGDWFKYSESQLIGAWVGAMVASAATTGFVVMTFEPSASVSNLANIQLMMLAMRVFDIAFAGIAAMILQRVDQLQEAARQETAVEGVFE